MGAKIIIADDHPLMLRGLSDFIASKGHDIVGSAKDGKSAYNLIVKHQPDIAILDISMPFLTGLDVAKLCKNKHLDTKVILITFDNEEHLFDKAQEYNVFGYILKDFAIEELENCIASVTKGKPYFTKQMAQYLESKNSDSSISKTITQFTPTECKILYLIAQKHTSVDIANTLNSSIRTIEKHRGNILKKLKLEQSPNTLTKWVIQNRDIILKTCN